MNAPDIQPRLLPGDHAPDQGAVAASRGGKAVEGAVMTRPAVHEMRDLASSISLGNALTIVATGLVLALAFLWLAAPSIAAVLDALTAPHPACAAQALSGPECGELLGVGQ